MTEGATGFDALILAGGSARRMGGRDKPSLRIGGHTLLDRVLAAVATAAQVIVVGPQRPTRYPVTWVREQPPGGGPAAALAAGLRQAHAARIVLFAADLPLLTSRTVADLLTRLDHRSAEHPAPDGVVLESHDGHPQWLAGAWRTDRLRAVLPDDGHGVALHSVLSRLRLAHLCVDLDWRDVDTPEDLADAQRIVAAHAADEHYADTGGSA